MPGTGSERQLDGDFGFGRFEAEFPSANMKTPAATERIVEEGVEAPVH